jgi:hypothetical protein
LWYYLRIDTEMLAGGAGKASLENPNGIVYLSGIEVA